MFTIFENIVIFIIELFQKFGILKTYLYICIVELKPQIKLCIFIVDFTSKGVQVKTIEKRHTSTKVEYIHQIKCAPYYRFNLIFFMGARLKTLVP